MIKHTLFNLYNLYQLNYYKNISCKHTIKHLLSEMSVYIRQNIVFIFISYKNIMINNNQYNLMLLVSYSIIDNTKNIIKNYIFPL
jgi:NADH:ubiquinone oxidoreductase subunit K